MTKKTNKNIKKIATTTIAGVAAVSALTPIAGQVGQVVNQESGIQSKAHASATLQTQVGTMTQDLISVDGYVYGAGTPVIKSVNGNWYVSIVYGEMPTGPAENQTIAKVPAQYVGGVSNFKQTFSDSFIYGQENLISMGDIKGPAGNNDPDETVNKIALQASIETAQARLNIADQYTADSIAKLKTVLGQAQTVFNSSQATQAQVDDATNNLNAAISGLVAKPAEVDKSALQAIVDQSTDAYNNPQKYTTDSWTPFKSAYEGAVSVLNNASATDLQVDDARFLLNNKFNALVEQSTPSVNKDALTSIIATAGGYIQDEGKYTSETIEALKTAVSQGQSVLSNANSTQADVDNAVSSIQNAIDGLTVKAPEVNKSDLSNTIKQAEDKINSGKLTTDSQSKLKSQVDEAKTVLNNTSATQTDVDQATSKLKAAISSVVERGDVTKLQSVINTAKEAIASGKYTDESVTALASAVEKAETVVKDGNATQSVVDEAVTQLQSSIDGLVEIPAVPDVDRSELTSVIKDAEDKINSGEYTDDSVSELQKVLDDAIKVRDNKDATQDDVDNAAKNVKDAVGSLVTKPVDFSSLEKAIDDATKLAESGKYTQSSVDKLSDAIKDATKVLNDENAKQSEVDKATKTLQDATKGLVELATETDKADLLEAVKNAKSTYIESDKYTTASLSDLNKAIERAQKVIDNQDASKADVEKAMSDIKSATEHTVEKASDYTKLEDAIKLATEKIESGKYTDKTVQQLKDVVEKAKDTLDNKDIAQSDVDKVVSELEKAIGNLAEKPTDNGNTEKPGENGGNNTKPDTGGNNNSGNTSKPGDTGSVAKPSTPSTDNNYVIQEGDTLTDIANKFGTDVQKLVDANQLANPDLILTGDVINIPSEQVEEQPVVAESNKDEVKTDSEDGKATKAETPKANQNKEEDKSGKTETSTSENKDEVKTLGKDTNKDDSQNQTLLASLGALVVAGGVGTFLLKRKRKNNQDEGSNL